MNEQKTTVEVRKLSLNTTKDDGNPQTQKKSKTKSYSLQIAGNKKHSPSNSESHMMGCRKGRLFHQIHRSLFLGDFNQIVPQFNTFQFPTICHVPDQADGSFFMGTVKDAFTSLPLSPLRSSEHISGILLPANQTILKSSRCKGQKLNPAVMDLCSAHMTTVLPMSRLGCLQRHL